MINLLISYSYSSQARFDFDYYCQQHIPLAVRLLSPACKGARVLKGLAGATPGSAPQHTVVATLSFESIETFAAAIEKVEAQIVADIANFTDIKPVIELTEECEISTIGGEKQ